MHRSRRGTMCRARLDACPPLSWTVTESSTLCRIRTFIKAAAGTMAFELPPRLRLEERRSEKPEKSNGVRESSGSSRKGVGVFLFEFWQASQVVFAN